MADITLSSRVRTNLLALQNTSDLMSITQGRLATGKKVNSALDNASAFFQATGMSDRANKLSSLLDGINNGISTIKAASQGLDSIYKSLQAIQGVIDKAKADTNPSTTAYIAQVNALRTSIDQTAGDASFNGVNLLTTAGSLTVNFNEGGTSSITVAGVNSNTTGLSVAALAATGAGSTFQASDFTAVETAVKAALDTVRTTQSSFANSLTIMQNRQEFSKNLINTLKTGSDNLTNADTNEEAANLLALQTRQQLSQTALSLSNQADQAVLRLFG
jgi:flagellin-like hook-associated protein FlgL